MLLNIDFLQKILELTNLSSLILMKLIISLIYLIINYITHKIKLQVTLANVLRLVISPLDFAILLILLFRYAWEFCVLGYTRPLTGLTVLILTCSVNWAMLIRRDKEIQPVFIVGMFSFIVLILLNWLSILTNFAYTERSVPALLLLNTVYLLGWLIFELIAKKTIRLAESIGDYLVWVDPLIGDMLHKDLALRNVCSFNLGLLNLAYIHISLGGL